MSQQREEEYVINDFLDYIYQNALPDTDFLTCPAEDMEEEQRKAVAGIKKVLRLQKMQDQLGTEMNWENRDAFQTDGIWVEKYSVSAIRNLKMAVYVARPEKEKDKGKAVLYLHGHDPLGSLAAVSHLTEESYHNWICIQLAQEGYTVFVPELLGFGEAAIQGYPYEEGKRHHCYPSGARLLACGYSLSGIRVFQAMKTLDFAECMNFQEAALVGISGGAMAGAFLGAVEKRVCACVLSAWANTYKDSIFAMRHCICNYIPDMVCVGENYHVTACIAPRPLLVMNGDWDHGFPVWGTEKAFAYLKETYRRKAASEKLVTLLFEGDKLIDDKTAIKWIKSVFN